MSNSDTAKENNVIKKGEGGEEKEKLSREKIGQVSCPKEENQCLFKNHSPPTSGGNPQYVFWKIFRIATDKSLFSGISVCSVIPILPLSE